MEGNPWRQSQEQIGIRIQWNWLIWEVTPRNRQGKGKSEAEEEVMKGYR